MSSGYGHTFNRKYARSGSLFRQKTKAKCLTETADEQYAFVCFHYIHQNPVRPGLVDRMEEWEYSSFRDYLKTRNGTICQQDLAYQYLNLAEADFYAEAYQALDERLFPHLFVR